MIRVGIAGPPGILRTGLETLVRNDSDMQLAFAADSLDEAAGAVDVIVSLDPDLDAVGAMPVVFIGPSSAEFVRAALRAGAAGVLPPDCTASELSAAIEAAGAGLATLRRADAEALTQAVEQPTPAAADTGLLSPRETEVLRLLADGLANKEIGYRLGISEHTVKFHVNSILTRLNAGTRAEAVAIGIRRGLLLL